MGGRLVYELRGDILSRGLSWNLTFHNLLIKLTFQEGTWVKAPCPKFDSQAQELPCRFIRCAIPRGNTTFTVGWDSEAT